MTTAVDVPFAEMFPSIQGEGINAGRSAIFLRYMGCNLNCPFCDTKWTWAKSREKFNRTITPIKNVQTMLIRLLESGRAKHLVITGGEPSLYIDKTELILNHKKILRNLDSIEIETNGLTPVNTWTFLEKRLKVYNIDLHVTISPKFNEADYLTQNLQIKNAYAKLLVSDITQVEADINMLKKHFPYFAVHLKNIFLQPMDNDFTIARDIIKHGEHRLSLQLHKILEVQ